MNQESRGEFIRVPLPIRQIKSDMYIAGLMVPGARMEYPDAHVLTSWDDIRQQIIRKPDEWTFEARQTWRQQIIIESRLDVSTSAERHRIRQTMEREHGTENPKSPVVFQEIKDKVLASVYKNLGSCYMESEFVAGGHNCRTLGGYMYIDITFKIDVTRLNWRTDPESGELNVFHRTEQIN